MNLSRIVPYVTAGLLAVAAPVYSQPEEPVQLQQTAQRYARSLAKIVLGKHTRKVPVTRIVGFPPHQREEPTGAIEYWLDIKGTQSMKECSIKFVDNDGDGVPGKNDLLAINQSGLRDGYGFIEDYNLDGFPYPMDKTTEPCDSWHLGRMGFREGNHNYRTWDDKEIEKANKEYTNVMKELITFLEADKKK
ncbi:hypothetical protein HY497_01330 [Candidatus Woesearchaeota archaeon]|nr:hypothetical protein [Candidatus Woesearchaeota archaeon]